MATYNPEEYNFIEINRAGGLMFQIMLDQDDDAIVNGFINVLDLKDVTMGHFLQMTPSFAKKMTVFQEEAIPMRTKGTHFINTPAGFDKIFNMFKPMMSKKNQGRVSSDTLTYFIHNIYDIFIWFLPPFQLYVHGNNFDSLYEQIPRKYLPTEYGGENGSIEQLVKDWEQRILAYRQYWVEENNYGTDERLRPGKPVDFESLFGMEGSFRQLNVD